MIENILIGYLAEHKRIIIPELGALIKKDSDSSIVFVPFLTQDDGVLINLTSESYGISIEQATTIIQEYANLVKNHIAKSGQFVIKGMGVLRPDENQIIFLDTVNKHDNPVVKQVDTTVRAHSDVTPITFNDKYKTPTTSEYQQRQGQSANPVQPMQPTQRAVSQPTVTAWQQQPQSARSEQQSQSVGSDRYSSQPPQRPATQSTRTDTQTQSVRSEQRGSQTVKTVNIQRDIPGSHNSGTHKKFKSDMFVVIAILAAAIALAAMIYGYVTDSGDMIDLGSTQSDEVVITD